MVLTKVQQSEISRNYLTISEKDYSEPEKFKQFLASILATLSALSMGMCLSWSSPAVPMLLDEQFQIKVRDEEAAWIASLITLGACFGAIPTGSLSNLIGRKRTLQLLALPLFGSWLLIAFGMNVTFFYIARFLAGLAIGGISVAAPMYVAEIAHVSIRGTLGTFFQVQITIGLLMEYILGGIIVDFKFLALASAILPVLFLMTFSFMPETPVYLYTKGRCEEAWDSLIYFRGSNYNIDDEMTKMADDIKAAINNKAKLSDLINCKSTFNGLIISLGLMVFQQLSGINAVLFYANRIFAETGSSLSPNVCTVLVGTVQVIATLLSTLLIDKAGRKILLFISSFVMSICLVTLGVYFYLKEKQDLSYLNVLPIVCLAVFIVVFSIGFGPIPWIMMGEMFKPNSKGIASSISAAFNWILAFTVTNQFQNMVTNLGHGLTFILFGFICAVAVAFVVSLVPETRGKDAEQVENLLLNNKVLNCMKRPTA